jgi:hypothetical protein
MLASPDPRFYCRKNWRLCNGSATKTPSHKEKILISKQYTNGKNSFLKRADDGFPYIHMPGLGLGVQMLQPMDIADNYHL